jgi:hypothetical protein
MWISLFAVGITASLLLVCAALMMQEAETAMASAGSLPVAACGTFSLAGGTLERVSPAQNPRCIAPQEFGRDVQRLQNMADMMARLGLRADAQVTGVVAMKDAYRACQACAADGVCRDWLARADKSLTSAPAFCPNAARFAAARQLARIS